MKIEEAIQKLKYLELKDFGRKRKFDLKESEVAYITILNELKKKDKVIDMMAEQIRASDIDEDICKLITEPIECHIKNGKCKNCIKEFFYKKAEEN